MCEIVLCEHGFLGGLLHLLGLLDFKLRSGEEVGREVLLQPCDELLRGIIEEPHSGVFFGRVSCAPSSVLVTGYCCRQIAPSATTCLRWIVLCKNSILQVDASGTRCRDFLEIWDFLALVASRPIVNVVVEVTKLARPCAVVKVSLFASIIKNAARVHCFPGGDQVVG